MDDNENVFESIKQQDDVLGETWSARDLQKALGYTNWRGFENVINKAKNSFLTSKTTSNQNIDDHFGQVIKMIPTGKGAERPLKDYRLSKYACYLIAQNGDPRKDKIALAQSYFNIQTLRQEQFDRLSEDERRLYIRQQVVGENKKLFNSAKASGVKNYGEFYDAGYLGLYGLRAKEICDKKGLGSDKLLDRAGATELAANLFRITQTNDKLKGSLESGDVIGNEAAANTHYMVGSRVRQTIEEIGGTMPENLPPEPEHIKKIERRLHGRSKSIKPNKPQKNLPENHT